MVYVGDAQEYDEKATVVRRIDKGFWDSLDHVAQGYIAKYTARYYCAENDMYPPRGIQWEVTDKYTSDDFQQGIEPMWWIVTTFKTARLQ